MPLRWTSSSKPTPYDPTQESTDAARKKALWAKVSNETATVSDVKAKVGKDKAALVAEENKELLEVEHRPCSRRSSARTRRGRCPSSSAPTSTAPSLRQQSKPKPNHNPIIPASLCCYSPPLVYLLVRCLWSSALTEGALVRVAK